ncbi:hypothetical protein D0437_32125 [Bacillus cereus]|uniref:Transposase n=1 Tax=Bacillus cereus TaxID=1396 RepID=A0A9X7M1X0_BACCE|nr:hypothetical protein D0437_32125 [Bacillus cereus]
MFIQALLYIFKLAFIHGYRYARFRGLKSVQMQAYLTAACQNMKKIALHLTKKGLVEGYFF